MRTFFLYFIFFEVSQFKAAINKRILLLKCSLGLLIFETLTFNVINKMHIL